MSYGSLRRLLTRCSAAVPPSISPIRFESERRRCRKYSGSMAVMLRLLTHSALHELADHRRDRPLLGSREMAQLRYRFRPHAHAEGHGDRVFIPARNSSPLCGHVLTSTPTTSDGSASPIKIGRAHV